MNIVPNRGAKISVKNGFRGTILEFLRNSLEKGCFDGILIPMRVPADDSYAWVLIRDKPFLDNANPIAPIVSVQGAKALTSLTRKGGGNFNVAAIMKPCDIRASIELSKLKQVNLEKITLISYDCPGTLEMSNYIENPEESEKIFGSLLNGDVFDDKFTKPICQICDNFSFPACDLHFALLGTENGSIYLIPGTEKGENILDNLGIEYSEDLSNWEKKVIELIKKKEKQKAEKFKLVKPTVEGFDNLLKTFANCIGCHNCQSACPICYCRQCYFDSEVSKPNSDFILLRTSKRGGISFPLDRIMFHTGRMSHMSLSCVSCGVCTDACPVSIPVADIFSYVADKTQRTFEYKAGNSTEEPLPMREYRFDELLEIKELVKDADGQD